LSPFSAAVCFIYIGEKKRIYYSISDFFWNDYRESEKGAFEIVGKKRRIGLNKNSCCLLF